MPATITPVGRAALREAVTRSASALGHIDDAIAHTGMLDRGTSDLTRGVQEAHRDLLRAVEHLDAVRADVAAVHQAHVGVARTAQPSLAMQLFDSYRTDLADDARHLGYLDARVVDANASMLRPSRYRARVELSGVLLDIRDTVQSTARMLEVHHRGLGG